MIGTPWGNQSIDVERRYRVKIAVAAYAAEIVGVPFLSDFEWDRLAQSIHPKMGVGHPLLDDFFAGCFTPMSTMWIRRHPELAKVAQTYERHYADKAK